MGRRLLIPMLLQSCHFASKYPVNDPSSAKEKTKIDRSSALLQHALGSSIIEKDHVNPGGGGVQGGQTFVWGGGKRTTSQ